MSSIYNKELTRTIASVEEDVKSLGKITVQIQSLEQNVGEIGLKLRLERESITPIKQCRSLINEKIKGYCAMLHRGRDLPTEMLIKNFELAVESKIDFIHTEPSSHQSFAVVRSSSICAEWRYLVYKLPQLWRYLPLPSSDTEPHLEMIRLYARNCGESRHIIAHRPLSNLDVNDEPNDPILSNHLSYLVNQTGPSTINTFSNALSIEILRRYTVETTSEVECNWGVPIYKVSQLIPTFTDQAALQVTSLDVHIRIVMDGGARTIQEILRKLPRLQHLNLQVEEWVLQYEWDEPVNLELLKTLSALPTSSTTIRFLPILEHSDIGAQG